MRDHPQGLGPAVGLQRRHGGRGAGAPGQDGRGRALRAARAAASRPARSARRATSSPATSTCRRSLEITLNDGVDPRTGRQIGAETGDPAAFATFDELLDAFRAAARGTSSTSRSAATTSSSGCTRRGCRRRSCRSSPTTASRRAATTTPAARATTRATSCRSARARRPTACRRSSTTSSTSGDVTMADAASRRCATTSSATRRCASCSVNKTPKYGNDDPYADAFVDAAVRRRCSTTIDGRRGHDAAATYHVNYLSTTCHVYFGSVCGATPDGRHAWVPVSDGISPAHGADRHGPTAVHQVGGAHGPRAQRRHAAQPEVHAGAARGRGRASTSWRTWCARTSSWTATTSSSTW